MTIATDPSGPPDTRPPNKPTRPDNPPPPPKDTLADELDTADLLLRSIGVLSLPGMDPALRMQLQSGLRTARRAVAVALSPARRDLDARARVPAVATSGGPGRAGEPPLSGAGFDLPTWPGTALLAASFARRAD